MKILTKKWREQYEQVRVIHWLKEVDTQKISYEEIQKKSRNAFNDKVYEDRGHDMQNIVFLDDVEDEQGNKVKLIDWLMSKKLNKS